MIARLDLLSHFIFLALLLTDHECYYLYVMQKGELAHEVAAWECSINRKVQDCGLYYLSVHFSPCVTSSFNVPAHDSGAQVC